MLDVAASGIEATGSGRIVRCKGHRLVDGVLSQCGYKLEVVFGDGTRFAHVPYRLSPQGLMLLLCPFGHEYCEPKRQRQRSKAVTPALPQRTDIAS